MSSNNGQTGEHGDGQGSGPTFEDRTRASLMALGEGLSMLNRRIGVAEGIASVTADANVFRTVEERLDAQDRRIGELQAALVSLARTLGVSPVWSDEGGNRPATH